MGYIQQAFAAALLSGATLANAQTAPPHPDVNTMTKDQLVTALVTRAHTPDPVSKKSCDLQKSDKTSYNARLIFALNAAHESALRPVVGSDVRVCLDQRMTRPGTWDFTSKTIWGAYYNHKDVGKVLALADDGNAPPTGFWNALPTNNANGSGETISRFTTQGINASPQGTTSFATVQSTVGRVGGSRDERNNVQWGQTPTLQMHQKGLYTAPLALIP